MKIRISQWDGRKLHLVKEVQIDYLGQIVDEVGWMNDNGICGEFLFVPENERDETILDVWNKIGEKYDDKRN